MTLSGFLGLAAVDTDDGAGAIDLGVLGHRLALLVVLVFSMGASTDGANNRVLWTRAAGALVTERPASDALGDQRASLVFTGPSGAIPKQEWRVSHDVLKTRTIRVKESNGDRTMARIRLSGYQPVWVAQQNKVL